MQEVVVPALKRPRLNLQGVSRLVELAEYSFAFGLRTVAAIGIADHLADGPRDIDDLAARTACDPHALIRILRMLAMKSVFAEAPAGTFALAPLGELLRTDHPLSMRWVFRLEPDVSALTALAHTIRTGQPAFEHVFGTDYLTWQASNAAQHERCLESERALNRLELIAIAHAFDWRTTNSIVDVGGNDRSLVAGLLTQFPHMTGTVVPLPKTADHALPADADVYVMKRLLIGFSDDQATLALTAVRTAMSPRSRLLIMEPLRSSRNGSVSSDIELLALGAGRLRNADEFERLLFEAGLQLVATRPAELLTIVEAVARRR